MIRASEAVCSNCFTVSTPLILSVDKVTLKIYHFIKYILTPKNQDVLKIKMCDIY